MPVKYQPVLTLFFQELDTVWKKQFGLDYSRHALTIYLHSGHEESTLSWVACEADLH